LKAFSRTNLSTAKSKVSACFKASTGRTYQMACAFKADEGGNSPSPAFCRLGWPAQIFSGYPTFWVNIARYAPVEGTGLSFPMAWVSGLGRSGESLSR